MTFPCHKRRKVELSLQRISFVSLCVSCPLHDMCFATSSLFFETVKAATKKMYYHFLRLFSFLGNIQSHSFYLNCKINLVVAP